MKKNNDTPVKNEFGKTDYTAFNAMKKIKDSSFEIIIEGKKYIGKQNSYVSKTEILKKVKELIGQTIHRNTFLGWERKGLINKGSKKGRNKLYPPSTPHEIHANWLLMHGPLSCSPEVVKQVRTHYYEALETGTIEKILSPFGTIEVDEKNPEIDFQKFENPEMRDPITVLTFFWVRYKTLSEAGYDPLDNSKLIISCKSANPSPDKFYDYTIGIS